MHAYISVCWIIYRSARVIGSWPAWLSPSFLSHSVIFNIFRTLFTLSFHLVFDLPLLLLPSSALHYLSWSSAFSLCALLSVILLLLHLHRWTIYIFFRVHLSAILLHGIFSTPPVWFTYVTFSLINVVYIFSFAFLNIILFFSAVFIALLHINCQSQFLLLFLFLYLSFLQIQLLGT